MPMLDTLNQYAGLIGLGFTLFGAIFLIFKSWVSDKESRLAVITFLEGKSGLKRYQTFVSRYLLDPLNHKASKNGGLYWLVLRIAIIYPIVFLFIGYALGGSGKLGEVELFDETLSSLRRGLFILTLPFIIIITRYVIKNYFTLVFKVWLWVQRRWSGKNVQTLFMVTSALITIIISLIVTFVGGVLFGIVFGVILFGVVLSVVVSVAAPFGTVSVVVGCVGVFVTILGKWEITNVALFFLFILPFANSILDYASLLVSRGLIRRASEAKRLYVVLIDLVADSALAVALTIGVAMVLPAAFEGWSAFTSLFGWERIEWRQLALTARDAPFTEGLGVTLMIFSTLIPTAIHMIVGLFASILMPLGRKPVARFLSGEVHQIHYSFGAFYLTIYFLLSICIVIGIPLLIVQALDFRIAYTFHEWVMSSHSWMMQYFGNG